MILSQKSLSFARKLLKHNATKSTAHKNCSPACTDSHQSPPPSQLKPYLHVHDHRKQRQIYQKPTQQKLQNMRAFKQQGNQFYKNQNYKQAAYFYQNVIVYADYTFPENAKHQQDMDAILQQANCNLGITMVKLGSFKESLTKFVAAAKGPAPKLRKKSFYWQAKVYIQIDQFEKASTNIQELSKFQESHKQIQQLESLLKTKRSQNDKNSKDVFSNMFSK